MNLNEPRQLAFYGKGGIGKSTVVANVAVCLFRMGHSVLQIGCDPKHDSSRPFLRGNQPRTVIELLRRGQDAPPTVEEYLMKTESGIHCIEVGGPRPGVGCAGRGILKMFELLEESRLLDSGYDMVLYDVLGDVVCGGFAAPMRAGYAKEICVVISGEFMALYAANNICRGIANYASRRKVRLAGFVLNCRDVPAEAEVADAFAAAVGAPVLGAVPRDGLVARAELKRRPVMELFPDSGQAAAYSRLTDSIVHNKRHVVPTPMDDAELERMYHSLVYGE